MTKGFANVFIFPCSQCNYPVVVCSFTTTKQTRAELSGQHLRAFCQFCPKEAFYLTDDAAAFQQVEWNLETHSQFHTKRT